MTKVKTKTTIAERIRARFNEFKPAERKIAPQLLGNYPMAGLLSITDGGRANYPYLRGLHGDPPGGD